MEMKVPTNMPETLAAIVELQVRSEWLQGQCNLLVAFVTASPSNRQAFANFSKAVAASTGDDDKEMRLVAQQILAAGLEKSSSPDPPPSPTGGKPKSSLDPKIVKFPRKPSHP